MTLQCTNICYRIVRYKSTELYEKGSFICILSTYTIFIRLRYGQKLALTSPTCGGRSVDIVRLRTKATEFSFMLWAVYSENRGVIINFFKKKEADCVWHMCITVYPPYKINVTITVH
jgi:hypothetical protein